MFYHFSMNEIEEIWEEIKTKALDLLPSYKKTFLNKLTLVSLSDDKAEIAAESDYVLDNIKSYKTVLENLLSDKEEKQINLTLYVDASLFSNKEVKKTKAKPVEQKAKKKNSTLNPNYTMSNFIQGDNCDIAYRAAEVISLNPGTTTFNPCLIYGGVGLGKTHLLQAIGNAICDKYPDLNVIYVTAESFTNEFINSFGIKEENNKFKRKYRNADVLLIDDIHFLQKKTSTQEELFHTFVELYHNNKQIVFTCDRPITELTDITDRLKTRFSSGLNVDLRPPEYEVRVAIAKQKNKDAKLDLPDNVIEYVCQAVQTNVRDLIGALITISGVSKLVQKPANIEMAKDQLKNLIIEPTVMTANYSINDVFTSTANYYSVSLLDMKGTSRSMAIKVPRQLAIYIAYKYGHFTQSDIGKYLNKDHTSIGYTVQQVEAMIENNDTIRKTIESIVKTLG